MAAVVTFAMATCGGGDVEDPAVAGSEGGGETLAELTTFTTEASQEVDDSTTHASPSSNGPESGAPGDDDDDDDDDGALPPDALPPGATAENLRVAFIGDQGTKRDSEAVLQMIADLDTELVIHGGDFDYGKDPDAWDEQINDTLGANYPYFASVGNHDKSELEGYQKKMNDRLQRVEGADCHGEVGVKMRCSYRGLFFILSGVGTVGTREEHAEYLETELGEDQSIWRICDWHSNQHDMQAGGGGDGVGWEVYQACQNQGAIIGTGHEHSYSRTLTLTDLGNREAGHGATGTPDVMHVSKGSTFVFVSGIGGNGIRDYHASEHNDDTWWSTIYTEDYYLASGEVVDDFELSKAGALFVDFYVDGDPRKAYAWFQLIDGQVIDEFEIRAEAP